MVYSLQSFYIINLKIILQNIKQKKLEIKDIKSTLRRVKKFFTIIAFYIFLNNTSKYTLSLFLPLFLTKKGFSVEMASIYFGIFQAFGILGAFYAGRISDKIGRSNALYITTIGIAIFLALFLWQSNIIFLAPLGFFVFTTSPIILAYVHDIKTNTPTFINSIYMAINFGISSITIYFAGIFAQKFGLSKMFKVTIILTLISLIFVYNLRKLKI
ncbi:MFS transporter [Caminibacter mediatlanticus]|uniref:MFS transporter n=1 Tax=Caminibacter mediatlanticus TaxID=291048 RepID=UPI0031453471